MPAWQGLVTIAAHEDVAAGFFKLGFDSLEVAAAVPGQFVNLRLDAPELCLRRPISIHAVDGDRVTCLIGVVGAGTARLSELRVGDRLDVMGPLGGRGLSLLPGARRVALVGGGVGIPPLHFLATRRPAGGPELLALVGARTAARLLCLDELAAAGCAVIPSTDDGTLGYHGTNVAALASEMERRPIDQILACGPTPMMRAAAELAAARGVPCQVCLEARMACALGACLSCVVETRTEGWRRYQRVCTEGPVFDAADIVWETLSPLCAV